jgi:hypothetical protein
MKHAISGELILARKQTEQKYEETTKFNRAGVLYLGGGPVNSGNHLGSYKQL